MARRWRRERDSSHDVTLWEIATGKERARFRDILCAVWLVVFSPDGKTLVSGSVDQTIKFWDVLTSKPVRSGSLSPEELDNFWACWLRRMPVRRMKP